MGAMVADGAASTNSNITTMATAATAATTFDPATGAAVSFDQKEYERRLSVYLEQQLAGYKGPVRVERALVEMWEDGFLQEAGNVSWVSSVPTFSVFYFSLIRYPPHPVNPAACSHVPQDDIEYAYAYEGIIVPGGKIMMGRWWRCAEAGFGEGRELVEGGGGDRGPWLFWGDD